LGIGEVGWIRFTVHCGLGRLIKKNLTQGSLFQEPKAIPILQIASKNGEVQPSHRNRKKKFPKRKPGKQYSESSYNRAITTACKKAGVPVWTPNQLRHSAATEVRQKFGLEAAQMHLGHASADTTQIYAETDIEKAVEVARKLG
jgi:integrase